MLLVSFTKSPGGFPYVFIITTKVTTFVPIYGTTLVDHRVFVLGEDQEVLDGAATFEVGLNAISTTDLLDAFHLVQSPFRIFTFSESLPKMVHFLLEQLQTAGHCFGPMGEGIYDTEFG